MDAQTTTLKKERNFLQAFKTHMAKIWVRPPVSPPKEKGKVLSMDERENSIIENIKKRFAKHEVKDLELEGPVHRLSWKKPDTMTDSLNYLLHNGVLCVTGDLGEAIYQWHGRGHTFEWIADTSFPYFLEKCQASETGRSYKTWDQIVARIYAKKYLDEYVEEEAEEKGISEELSRESAIKELTNEDAFENMSSEFEWAAWVNDHQQLVEHYYGQDYWEFLYSTGTVPHYRAYCHWVGIKCAVEWMNRQREEDGNA